MELGALPRRSRRPGRGPEAWVVASYNQGGLDNLVELLRETGKAIHLTSIDARPAVADQPADDAFDDALGDLTALEVYDPRWQVRYLGDSIGTATSLRAEYSDIMIDVASALFEIRLYAEPDRDPNALWSTLTSEYLGIVPHPELSWWAMRTALVERPGFMVRRALSAIIAIALRRRVTELRGPLFRPDRGMHAWLSERLYRFGLQRSPHDVLTGVLGGPPTTEPIVAELAFLVPR